MCTVIPKRRMNHPLIAKKDIVVYKEGGIGYEEDFFMSTFMRYEYRKDVLYTTEMAFTKSTEYYDNIEGSYHNSLSPNNRAYVNKGFHALLKLDRKRFGVWAIVGKFIIPQGSLYYKNKCGNIVSNQIIFKKIIS